LFQCDMFQDLFDLAQKEKDHARLLKLPAQLLIPMNEEYIHLAREYIHEQQNLLRLSSFLNFNKKQGIYLS
jgi:hypothetical protein